MSEDFHKFKEDIENIEIPADELQRVLYSAVNKAEAEKRGKRKRRYKGTMVSIGAAILSSLFLFSQMDEMENTSFSTEMSQADQAPQSALKQKKAEVQEIKALQIKEVLYDEDRLEITYEVPIDHEANAPAIEKTNLQLYADGNELNYEIHETQAGEFVRGTISVLNNKQLPSSFELEVEITKLFGKQGEWRFAFPLQR